MVEPVPDRRVADKIVDAMERVDQVRESDLQALRYLVLNDPHERLKRRLSIIADKRKRAAQREQPSSWARLELQAERELADLVERLDGHFSAGELRTLTEWTDEHRHERTWGEILPVRQETTGRAGQRARQRRRRTLHIAAEALCRAIDPTAYATASRDTATRFKIAESTVRSARKRLRDSQTA